MSKKGPVVILLVMLGLSPVFSQSDSIKNQKPQSSFDRFNAKAEALFKILPVPIISYSQEAGNILGLGKFNVFRISKKDTISRPSKLAEVATFSTLGRINISISNDLIFHENKWMILSAFNYQKTPEYIFGIGNEAVKENAEQVTIDKIRFATSTMRLVGKDYYAGVALDLANFFSVQTDSNSILLDYNAVGLDGGLDVGVGFAGAYDSRDNRYNASKGGVLLTTLIFYPKALGSTYEFAKIEIDGRRYFNPWLKHIIAVQATTTYTTGEVPFYDLAMLGGENKMRGYYKGAFRDKVLIDSQVEYRMPVWNIFGVTGWVGTGRVASEYKDMSLNGFKFNYGVGLRIRVDTKNNTNLRIDYGFGPNGNGGLYFNFAEAF